MVAGFAFDNFMLYRIDLLIDNVILIFYLVVVTVCIFLINLHEAGVLGGRRFYYVSSLAPFPMQFAFGGLFSVFTVFYTRSAALSVSWFFVLFLLFMLVGNEFFRSRYRRMNFQINVLFIAIFSYAVFAVPILAGRMGAAVFLLSGAASLAIIGALAFLLLFFMPSRARETKWRIVRSISAIFIVTNALYFLNIIPPIPLSLKEGDVYHSIARTSGGDYIGEREPSAWYDFFKTTQTMHLVQNEPAYFFSAVFAPTRLNTKIFHNWQYYDDKADEWKSRTRIELPVVGGRDGGYRGYSMKTNLEQGLWRVDVETERGQVLGRTNFTIERVGEPPAVETVVR